MPVISDRDSFAKHAAPESIVAHLKTARAARSRAEEEVDWLETLLARRQHQVREGEWPPPNPCHRCGKNIPNGYAVTGRREPTDRRWCSEYCQSSEYQSEDS